MKTMKTIWRFLNGNKTIITGALWGLFQTTIASKYIPPDTLEMLRWGTGTLAALSGVHHVSKGYLSTKVGNQGQEMIDPIKNKNVQK